MKRGRPLGVPNKPKAPAPHIHHAHYIEDQYHGAYRLWQSHHSNDSFDMIPIKEFPLEFVKKLPHLFVADFPEDDAGELVCALCKINRE